MGDISAMIQIRIGMRVCYDASVMCDSATPWTVAHQSPPSMGFSRQDYWSGLPFPSPGDPPDPGIEPRSPALQADALQKLFASQFSSVAQSCLTLCDPMDCSLPDSSVHGIFQARILEWVAISFSSGDYFISYG